jgi:hypothetical protein
MAGRMSAIHHACVVAGVGNPGEQCEISQLADPEYIALRSLFRVLHALTSQQHPRDPYPKPTKIVQRLLDQRLGFKVTSSTNDGFVPTLNQLHGRVLHIARGDHRALAPLAFDTNEEPTAQRGRESNQSGLRDAHIRHYAVPRALTTAAAALG